MPTIYLAKGARCLRTKNKRIAIVLEECGWHKCGRREYQAMVRRQEQACKNAGKEEYRDLDLLNRWPRARSYE